MECFPRALARTPRTRAQRGSATAGASAGAGIGALVERGSRASAAGARSRVERPVGPFAGPLARSPARGGAALRPGGITRETSVSRRVRRGRGRTGGGPRRERRLDGDGDGGGSGTGGDD